MGLSKQQQARRIKRIQIAERLDAIRLLEDGIDTLLSTDAFAKSIPYSHREKTPQRFAKGLMEMFAGVDQDPKTDALQTVFPDSGKEMICIKEISFFSMCAHHLIPFFGVAHFAYIPDGQIVGLSKIPRLVNVFARRPQVQEKLQTDILDAFQKIVEPAGCAIMIRAYHLCCMARGIKQPTSYTETTALRGVFEIDKSTKAEFLASCNAPKWSL